MSEELKPCPFCGSTSVVHDETNDEEWFRCQWCNATSGWNGDTPEGEAMSAADWWNRRSALTLSPDELRQVREALTECADDLAAYVEHEYPERFRDAVPSEDRRYKRDIEPVNRARAALAILTSKESKT